MKHLLLPALISILMVLARAENKPEADTLNAWKDYPAQVLTPDEIQQELAQKMTVVKEFLKQENLKGMLLTQVRNFYWMTAGQVNNQIVLNKDVGAASLLIMNDESKYLICNGSEAQRLIDEGLEEQGYTLKLYDWYKANPIEDVRGELIESLAKGGRIGSDVAYPGTILKADEFEPLRYSLTDTEIKRYRWLGEQTAKAIEKVCRQLKPGMSEYQIEALTASELRSRGIFPTVLLIGVDDRIYKYRHALPAGDTLQNYAMVNVVAEKWGMPMAVTRFVHFGPLSEELASKINKVAKVNARFQAATVPGKSCAEIFEECKSWYANVGFKGEWQKHHQGGAIGYDDREYVIYPAIQETVQNRQAFAWNPTITGAKVEDTIIAYQDHIEVVTRTENWPTLEIEVNGKIFPQPTILVRE